MSRMGRLAVEIDEAGIDYRLVNFEDVEAYHEYFEKVTCRRTYR